MNNDLDSRRTQAMRSALSAHKPYILNQKGGAIKSGKDKARTSARRESKACLRRGIIE